MGECPDSKRPPSCGQPSHQRCAPRARAAPRILRTTTTPLAQPIIARPFSTEIFIRGPFLIPDSSDSPLMRSQCDSCQQKQQLLNKVVQPFPASAEPCSRIQAGASGLQLYRLTRSRTRTPGYLAGRARGREVAQRLGAPTWRVAPRRCTQIGTGPAPGQAARRRGGREKPRLAMTGRSVAR